jgi:hypothetical protein
MAADHAELDMLVKALTAGYDCPSINCILEAA